MARYLKYHIESGHILGVTITQSEPVLNEGYAVLETMEPYSELKYIEDGEILDRVLGSKTNFDEAWARINGGAPIKITDIAEVGTYSLDLIGKYYGTLPLVISDVASCQAEKWEQIKQRRTQELLVVTTDKGIWDYDSVGKENIETAIGVAEQFPNEVQPTVPWVMSDNSVVDVSLNDLKAAILAGALKRLEVYNISFLLRDQIFAENVTKEQVKEIQWPSPQN
jgi:hypothetical protein